MSAVTNEFPSWVALLNSGLYYKIHRQSSRNNHPLPTRTKNHKEYLSSSSKPGCPHVFISGIQSIPQKLCSRMSIRIVSTRGIIDQLFQSPFSSSQSVGKSGITASSKPSIHGKSRIAFPEGLPVR